MAFKAEITHSQPPRKTETYLTSWDLGPGKPCPGETQ